MLAVTTLQLLVISVSTIAQNVECAYLNLLYSHVEFNPYPANV